ncbi:GntR family transcriptional regulator [Marivita cryptomonadis]|jgi:hypothetical protein|uniref:helix-turn-helix domain-containing protein n=1 Tax=Marivita cryptomonadis TaxID=505252 RepID=UPI000A20025D|nr:helix-turn-helix domain-containing protein [Marivita cryptomonadis]OSQ53590.1 GntR family transcriptional regulator [Marivita cryptomonadis]
MSHAATNWAIQQRGLKPTTKIVLWHLCDRFNPDYGCFPTQERLAQDCEIGRATLNRHLDELEARGLIRRVPIIDTKTGQQRPTRYLLGFEFGGLTKGTPDLDGGSGAPSNPPVEADETSCLDLGHGDTADTSIQDTGARPPTPAAPCLEPGHGPVSHFGANPCLKNGDSRVSKWDTNPVREPLSKPVKEEEGAQARTSLDEDFFGALLTALGFEPSGALPGWWQGWPPREHVRRWQVDLGLTKAEIVAAASASRDTHPTPPDGPKALDRVMQREARRKSEAAGAPGRVSTKASTACTAKPPSADPAAFYADWVNSNRYLPSSAITNAMRDQMLTRVLVTAQRLRERNIQ